MLSRQGHELCGVYSSQEDAIAAVYRVMAEHKIDAYDQYDQLELFSATIDQPIFAFGVEPLHDLLYKRLKYSDGTSDSD